MIVGKCVTFFTVYKDKTSLRFCDWDLRLVVLWLFRSEEGDVLFENPNDVDLEAMTFKPFEIKTLEVK